MKFNVRQNQCIKCNHYSAGGQHPCDPFCEKNKNIHINRSCSIYEKEHLKSRKQQSG